MTPIRFITITLWMSILLTGVSCEDDVQTLPAGSSDAIELEEVPLDRLQPGPIRHEVLGEELVERISRLQETFEEVDGSSLEEWIDNFRRDLDPESEVLVWEDMAAAYTKYCDGRDLALTEKQDVYSLVLLRSMMPSERVLGRAQLKLLSSEQAVEVLSGYPGQSKPITVIREE